MNIDITIRDASPADLMQLASFLNPTEPATISPRDPLVSTTGEVVHTGVETVVTSITPDEAGNPQTTFKATETGAEVDSRGFPWDARIHAATKTKTQAGEWKKKRGVDADEVTRIEAELMGSTNQPVQNVNAPVATTQNYDPVEAGMNRALGITPEAAAAGAAGLPQQTMPGAVQQAPEQQAAVDFGGLMATVMQRVANPADGLTEGTVNAILVNAGVMGGIAALANHPDKWATVASEMAKVQ